MYKRTLSEIIPKAFSKGFIVIIYGARRVGKTVLLQQIQAVLGNPSILMFNGDTAEAVEAFNTNSETRLSSLVKDHEYIFVDEAQNIPNITLALKIIIDKFPEKKIIITGSSSLALVRGATEHLTGRNISFTLFPLSTTEMTADVPAFKIPALLDQQLVFGSYPHVQSLSTSEEKKRYLSGIVENYLFQDVLLLERLDYPEGFKKMATFLAFQIGKEVSLNEIAKNLNISVKTVSRYLDLLEKSFVILPLGAYSSNLRNEISKNKKYYFYDLGIRNALVGQFQQLSDRVDVGELWENFLIMERIKSNTYSGKILNQFFWRNYSGGEIDLIEVNDGKISAFEFKWNKSGARTPKSFKDSYNVDVVTINKDNYIDWVS